MVQVSAEEQAVMDTYLQDAFDQDSDEAWQVLLDETGAAGDDTRSHAPLIDVQHSTTGAQL
jgi:hypothetical protein